MKTLVIALRASLLTLVVCCAVYPLLVHGIAHAVAPAQAEGSLVRDAHGQVVGSLLIGQSFTRPGYLQGRPSAAGAGYDPQASGGSNLGPTSLALRDRALADLTRLRTENPQAAGPVPAELVAASASGLDPHVSPAAAEWQAPRIASARGVDIERVREVIARHVEGRTFGILGEPRVNVLALNLALDAQFGAPP